MRIAGIVRESIVDGPGIRLVVFAQGCPHRCEGCHSEPTHDFSGGRECDASEVIRQVEGNPLLDGVTFSGGEPFCQPDGFFELAAEIKRRGLSVLVFTGYTYEELTAMRASDENVGKLLDSVDILIDGRFVLAERDLTQQFRGSANQRYIDMNATRERGEPAVLENL